ncbi:MAG: pirin family protein [Alphaproteobacteria bacterium]|nr:pirin family protein [Alphaproteobacteria bacterium]
MSVAVIQARSVERLVTGQPTSDGAGVKLTRVLTNEWQQRLDPFLMLDHFGSAEASDYIAGFPDHPHRGFETVTYMLQGRMRHRDSRGNEGLLKNGDVQWMTAGRGLIHSEMPEQEEGVMEGFQLWLNLPSHLKMCDPKYQDIPNAQLPRAHPASGVEVTVIGGSVDGTAGPIQSEHTQPQFWDMHFHTEPATFEQALPMGHHAFIYVYRGSVQVLGGTGPQQVSAERMAILSMGDGLRLQASAGSKAILLAGKPLREPIAQYGPFVMNNRQQLMEAVEDFRAGRLS